MRKVLLIVSAGSLLIGGCATPRPAPPESPRPLAATQAPAPTTTAAASPTPVVTKDTVVQEQEIPFRVTTVNDSSLAKGTTRVRTKGVSGLKRLTYEVTYTGGVESQRELIKEEVVRQPVTKVVVVGTKQSQPRCDPNYTWACVPIASDVDCAGGSGNGPAYVQGPVKVIGRDIYRLDNDGDGIGCET